MNFYSSNLLIFFFRTAGIGIKAIFMIFAVRALTSEQYGEFVIFLSNIALALSFLGINLNQYTSRKLPLAQDKEKLITDHFTSISLTGLVFLCFVPISKNLLGMNNTYHFFILIAFLEHLTYEAYCLLMPLGKALLANIILFIKFFGSYGMICIYFLLAPKGTITLSNVLLIWVASLILITGCLCIKFQPKLNLSFNVLKSGWKTGLVFLLVAIITKAFFNLDKIIISHYLPLNEVGIYGMIFSIAWTVHTLVEASLISPSLNQFLKSPDENKSLIKLLIKISVLYVVLWFIMAIGFEYITILLHKPELNNYKEYLHLFLLAGYFYTACLCVSMKLYVQHKDRTILISSILSLFFFIILMALNRNNGVSIAQNLVLVSFFYLIFLSRGIKAKSK